MPFTLNRGQCRVSGGGTVTANLPLALSGSASISAGGSITASGNAVILPNGELQFYPLAYSVNENDTIQIPVTRQNGSTGAVTVDWSLTGTSHDQSGTIAWGDGDPFDKQINITVGAVSSTETGDLRLSNPTGGADLGSPFAVGLDIVDLDPAGPLASCANVGSSDGTGYTITGTTYQSGADFSTIADVNALALSPGDAVLFQAGQTFNIGLEANRLLCRAGVTYGRYGAGANPIITARDVAFSGEFRRGIVNMDAVSNVDFDGIDIEYSGSWAAGVCMQNAADNITVRRLTISHLSHAAVILFDTTNFTLEYLEIFNVSIPSESTLGDDGGAPEAISMHENNDGFIVRYCHVHDNGKAGIDVKGNSRNGEIYGSEFSRTRNDPLFYLERCENIVVHDNWIHDNFYTYTSGATNKPLFVIGVENLGDAATRYCRNNEVYNNVLATANLVALGFTVKIDVSTTVPTIISGNHVHHNTIYNNNIAGNSWNHSIQVTDNRAAPDLSQWSNNIIENNIIWQNGNADGINFRVGTGASFTTRNNLFETGETGGPDLGSNAIYTATIPLTDALNDDFTPIGAALGAGHDGSDVGAAITWTCGL